MASLNGKLGSSFSNFVASAEKAEFNASTWQETGERYPLKKVWDALHPGLYDQIDGDKAEVVGTEIPGGDLIMEIAIPIKDGSRINLRLSSKSDLDEGDFVKISTIEGIGLKKTGSDNIVRYDGEIAE